MCILTPEVPVGGYFVPSLMFRKPVQLLCVPLLPEVSSHWAVFSFHQVTLHQVTCSAAEMSLTNRSISSSCLVFRRRVLSSCYSLVWDDCLRRRCSHRPSWSIFGQLRRKWAYLPHPKHRGSPCADQSG